MMNISNWYLAALTIIALASSGMILSLFRNITKTKGKNKKPLKRSLKELHLCSTWEKVGKVIGLWIYPVKSCAGIKFNEVTMEKNGPLSGKCKDRSLVIVDQNGKMINGKRIRSTVLVTIHYDDNSNAITLTYPNLQAVKINLSLVENKRNFVEVKIYNRTVTGFDCGDEAADWLNLALKYNGCRLLYYGMTIQPTPVKNYPQVSSLASDEDSTLYTDSSAFLLMNESSILDIQKKASGIHHPENFRPNILVNASIPYDEDDWTYIKIGEAIFRNTYPCGRCAFTTIDFKTSERDPNSEPLKTLRRYRLPPDSDSPNLGIYLAIDQVGNVQIGDDVQVLRT